MPKSKKPRRKASRKVSRKRKRCPPGCVKKPVRSLKRSLKRSKRRVSRKVSRKRKSAKRKASRKRKSAKRKSRKRKSAKRKASRKRKSAKRKASRKRKSAKRKASRKKKSAKRKASRKKKSAKRKSRKRKSAKRKSRKRKNKFKFYNYFKRLGGRVHRRLSPSAARAYAAKNERTKREFIREFQRQKRDRRRKWYDGYAKHENRLAKKVSSKNLDCFNLSDPDEQRACFDKVRKFKGKAKAIRAAQLGALHARQRRRDAGARERATSRMQRMLRQRRRKKERREEIIKESRARRRAYDEKLRKRSQKLAKSRGFNRHWAYAGEQKRIEDAAEARRARNYSLAANDGAPVHSSWRTNIYEV